ncbi:MAG TPA: glycosyltransferase family 39 protein [Thermodesulfobacteriota bacterium]|nr:glycosyltransferase family 39 protein [Thermodesulfobacteriota bacterium]
MWNRFDQKIFWILLLMMAGVIVINGTTTEISLGDESHHYRFAQNIYTEGKRVPYDPLYESGNPPGFFNNDPPLWHLILAFLWKVTGSISQAVAQIYQVLFFILLVWLTSLLAKETAGEERRWVPAFIIAAVPMVVSFSTLLYMDIPMTALSTLAFYMILKKRYIEAGVASGLMYFTKLNAGFFFPGFIFLIFWNERKKFWSLLKNLSFFTLPILMIYIPDLFWRRLNITSQMDSVGWSMISHRFSIGFTGRQWKEHLNSYLSNPEDLAKYLGFTFLFLLLIHFVRLRRWNKRDAIFWIPVVSYLIPFLIVFGTGSDIRYLIPILPFLAVLITPTFFSLGKVWRFAVIGVCVLQIAGTSYYVHQRRQIPPGVREGLEYIRENVPQNALILYPEENLLIYGQRRMIWSAVVIYRSGQKWGLNALFWASHPEEMNEVLRINQIDHILVKKSRVYDDHEIRHYGGYPKSFVNKLPCLDGWVKIFENSGVTLWKKV